MAKNGEINPFIQQNSTELAKTLADLWKQLRAQQFTDAMCGDLVVAVAPHYAEKIV